MKSINIIGAFDRYNYGDLLFPIIIEEYIKKYEPKLLEEFEVEFYGLVESDLSKVGGKKTKALRDLYSKKLEDGSMTIVSGGDVLPARISSMDIDLSSSNLQVIVKKIKRKLKGIEKFEETSKKNLGVNYNFPWVLDKKHFDNSYIAYNAVGGSTLDKLSYAEYGAIKRNLSKSDYISVRDRKTFDNVVESHPKLYPDSASIMSEFFPIEVLEEKITEEVKNKADSFKNGYICIQSNLASIKGKEEVLAREAEKICKENNLGLVLLPIGIAANHDDNLAFDRMKKHLKMDYYHKADLNLFEIMYLIARSNFFAGTSLHGNITSMSYGVRHIGLNLDITKLDKYLNTWDIDNQNHCIAFESLSSKYNKIKNVKDKELQEKKEEIINKTRENLNNIFKIL